MTNVFSKLNLGKKLVFSFMLVSFISALVGFSGIRTILYLGEKGDQLYDENVIGIQSISSAQMSFMKNRLEARALLLAGNKDKTLIYKNIKDNFDGMDEALKNYEKAINKNEDRKNYKELIFYSNEFKKNMNLFIDGINNKLPNEEMLKIISSNATSTNRVGEYLEIMSEWNRNDAKERAESNKLALRYSIILMTSLVLIGVLISISLGYIISKIITKPIKEISLAGEKLSKGDMNIEIKSKANDELGQLIIAFEELINANKEQESIIGMISQGDMTVDIKLRSENDIVNRALSKMVQINNGVFHEIKNSIEQVMIASVQVAKGATSTAQATTEQSSTIEEITATISDVAEKARENASNSKEANAAAIEAKENATSGSIEIENMVSAMTEINEASYKIAKIIKVIDDIAFQTNILALNAAVEAARAGTHGKGFAVVAEEVRNLAAKSAQAASETAELIEGTVEKITEGDRIAKKTAGDLNRILKIVENVGIMIEKINYSSDEQALSISQINQALMQISDTIQSTSAITEESAAASEQLANQAKLLNKSIDVFKLKKIEQI